MKTILKLKQLTLLFMLGMLSLNTQASTQAQNDGGIVVVAEGLTDEEIHIDFFQNHKGNLNIYLALKNAKRETIYATSSNNTFVQFPDLNLSSGEYRLEVSLNGELQGVIFSRAN